jgi:toxin-antitoxin system, toxin component, bro family
MNELQIIEEREVLGREFRIYGDFENPLFLAKDVAEWIEHTNVTKMLLGIDESEKIVLKIPTNHLLEGLQSNTEYTFLTEDGLYEVLMLSRKPIAKEFKKQVKEILKTIRKTGSYSKPMSVQDVLIATLEEQKKMVHRIEIVENKVDNEIRIDQSEQRKLQKAINIRVYQRLDVINAEKRLMFPAIHRDVKDRFGVASYRDIKRKDLTEALAYVQNWIEKAELRN